MEDLGIGKLITKEQHRDAIHIAVAPVVAGERLYAGWHIQIRDGRAYCAAPAIGIVDPFLEDFVEEDQIFWMFLYPGSITSLRHYWEHPAIVGEAFEVRQQDTAIRAKEESREWIEDYADSLKLDSAMLIAGAKDYVETGDYLRGGDNLEGEWTSSDFWVHYERLTGMTVPEEKRGNFFSCSC